MTDGRFACRAALVTGGGSIVAMSSIAGLLAHRFVAACSATKAGLEMLVRTAADELGVLGVRVNTRRPGLVPTAAFLRSDESSWITGVLLSVDGGHHLRGGPDIDPIVEMGAGPEFVRTVGLRPGPAG